VNREAQGAPASRRRRGAAAGPAAQPEGDGRRRVVIEGLSPEVDAGRYPVKRVVGELVEVELDAFTDGHDRIACVLRHRHEREADWHETPMEPLGNDRWRAAFPVTELGTYRYTAVAWVDHFASWRHDLERRPDDDPDLPAALAAGVKLIEAAAQRAHGGDAQALAEAALQVGGNAPLADRRRAGLAGPLARLMRAYDARPHLQVHSRELGVTVDRERARFSAWYEFFPRSFGADGRHGRFADCDAQLAYVAGMGFDVVYLPPIHPIGASYRKGPNNTLRAGPDDVGSPWAIGGAAGGHKAVHPQLGTLEDFRRFVERARGHGLEVALDIAYQCSPDHPYVKEHPEWFRRRPDGSIQYAENPPKKYQDIYPFDFESEAWPALWEELRSVVQFWVGQGVRIFRVDNPHTKPFPFWEWLIATVKHEHPDVLFLAEAFTRPRVMHRLAKLGFSQSYTYFTWRNTRHELTEYGTELSQGPGREYFRPNLWPNTPDILNEYLQHGGRPAFVIRATLAATMAANWGVYGPAFELCEAQPREPGSEEYRDSEKYQLRRWDLGRRDSLRDLLARLNRIRRENPALQSDHSLRFHATDNDNLLAYSKADAAGGSVVLAVVNLDPHHRQAGWLEAPLARLGVRADEPYQVDDLLGGGSYQWHGPRAYVELDPQAVPAHVFRVRRHLRREQDFETFQHGP
jgi:starch synthase (maltosyl-transferring)